MGHPYWGRGGAEIVIMHLVEALKEEYSVYIITRGGFNLNELNKCAGTTIKGTEIEIVNPPFSTILKKTTLGAMWDGLYRRYCRFIATEFDLCITGSRVLDWGVPAIHFLSDVTWNKALQIKYNANELQINKNIARSKLHLFSNWLAGSSNRSPLIYDTFVANSIWTAEVSSKYCKEKITVISPFIPGEYIQQPWNGRKNSFVLLGRISPEKKIEEAISLLKEVKERGHNISLEIIGDFDGSLYANKINSICEKERSWVKCHGSVYGNAKMKLLENFRFGVSACNIEAFGISTGEMIKAGVIPFVPYEGAQKEIVNKEELIYSNKKEAINKIICVLESEHLQVRLNKFLVERSKMFSAISFRKSVLKLVGEKVKLNSIEKLVSNK